MFKVDGETGPWIKTERSFEFKLGGPTGQTSTFARATFNDHLIIVAFWPILDAPGFIIGRNLSQERSRLIQS